MPQENQETKKCKYCQSEIPKKAKVCPQCRKKQGDKLKWIIIAIIVILFIAVVAGGEDDETQDVNNGSHSETESLKQENGGKDEPEKEIDSPLTVGSSFEKNGLKITLNEASADFKDYKNDYGINTPEDGTKYVMTSFTFENNGDSDAYVSIYDFKCYADNTSCDQVYSLDDSDFINTNLSSGRNVSFKTYYSVPIDAKSIELEYETNIWTGDKVIIKIQ